METRPEGGLSGKSGSHFWAVMASHLHWRSQSGADLGADAGHGQAGVESLLCHVPLCCRHTLPSIYLPSMSRCDEHLHSSTWAPRLQPPLTLWLPPLQAGAVPTHIHPGAGQVGEGQPRERSGRFWGSNLDSCAPPPPCCSPAPVGLPSAPIALPRLRLSELGVESGASGTYPTAPLGPRFLAGWRRGRLGQPPRNQVPRPGARVAQHL